MSLQFISTDFNIAILIISVVLFYYLYYYFSSSIFPKNYLKKNGNNELLLFLARKISGFLILGVIPLILYIIFFDFSFYKFGFTGSQLKSNFSIILILISIVALVTLINQKVNAQRNSLQLKLKEWTIFLFTLNSFGWIIYLIGYEFLFRGILLYECYYNFGLWPAIAINVAIYSAIHMINGKDEAFGALLFGTIACYFTLSRGTILIPIFMHISLSLFSDYFSILLNKNLSFIKKTDP